MRRDRATTTVIGVARRRIPLFALLVFGTAAAVVIPAPAANPGRTASIPVPAPRQPLGTAGRQAGPVDTAIGDARLSHSRLVAGRPGQRLVIDVRSSGGKLPRRLQVTLRRIERPDRGHPGKTVPASVEARGAAEASASGRRARVVLRGLNPLPGAHTVEIAGADRTAPPATVPLTVAAQSRLLPRARSRSSTAAANPSPQSLSASDVNTDINFEPGPQASSAIAVETDDPLRAIAATNDASGVPPAIVSDEGLAAGSGVRREMPGLAALPGGGTAALSLCCDPAVAADAAGNLWMAVTATGSGSRIVVNRIDPAGTSFNAVSTALPKRTGSGLQEKPALAVAGGDRIVAVWIEHAGPDANVVFSTCDISGDPAACDDPTAWSTPVAVTGASSVYSMPDVAIAPNGDVYAVWWDAGPVAGGNAIEINRCRQGEGCTADSDWNEEATIDSLDAFDDDGDTDLDPLPLFCPIIAAPGGLVNPSPSVAVGPSGYVFVAFGDLRNNPDPGAPTRCTATGTDETWDSLIAAGAAPDTVPAPNSAVRLSDDGATDPNDHFLPAMSVDPSTGAVEASFYSTVDDPGGQLTDRVYAASTDLGLTYSAPVAITTEKSRFSGYLSNGLDYGDREGAASAAGVFRPAWTDDRPRQARDADLYAITAQADTSIDSAPSGTVAEAISTFTFSTGAPRTECSIDGGLFASCVSPLEVGPLPNGPHTVDVRAVDAVANPADLSPASASWTILDLDPPETTLTTTPHHRTRNARPEFAFVADEKGAKFECSYDKVAFAFCRGHKQARVTVGPHIFEVRAIDVGGNIDPTPAHYRFRRVPKRKPPTFG